MKKILLVLFALSIFLSSCQKWLEEEQVATLSYGYFTTEQGCEALVNACYEALRLKTGDEWSYALFNYGTDEYMKGYEWTQPYAQPEYNDYTADLDAENKVGYPDIGDFWALVYNGIDRCNVAVDKITQLDFGLGVYKDQDGKDMRIAEVKFLRAYNYFMLVQQFGSLPFTMEPSSGLEDEWPRVAASIVYDSIVSDLEWAYNILPDEETQYGRVDKDAVRHYLAKVLLTRSSDVMEAGDDAIDYDLGGDPAADLQRAADLIDEIDDGGRHSLVTNYADLFVEGGEANDEMVFSIQYNDVDGLNGTAGSGYKNALHLYWFNQYDVDVGMTRNLEYGRPFRRLFMTDYAIGINDRLIDSRIRKSILEVHYCNETNAANVPTWTAEELLFAFDIVETSGAWALRYGDTIRAGEMKYAAATESELADRVNVGDTALVFLLNDETTDLTDRDMIAAGHTIYARYYWRTEGGLPVELLSHDREDDLLEFSGILVEGSTAIESNTWNRNKSPSLIKYWDRQKPGGYNSSVGTKDVYLARLAETYLLGAEAHGRLQDYSQAVYYINKVRTRAAYHDGEVKSSYWLNYDGGSAADLTASTETEMQIDETYWDDDSHDVSEWYPAGVDTKEDRFIAFILNERSRELLGEMHRWEDLKRTGTLLQRAYAFNTDVATYDALENFHRLRPIPNLHLEAIKVDGIPLTGAEKLEYQNEGYN